VPDHEERATDHPAGSPSTGRRVWRQTGAVPSVQIEDVPEHTPAVLRRRAAAAHQSLQEYRRSRLIAEAETPTLEEVLDRAGARRGGHLALAEAAALLRSERAGR
jgi:antitoxin FitA